MILRKALNDINKNDFCHSCHPELCEGSFHNNSLTKIIKYIIMNIGS